LMDIYTKVDQNGKPLKARLYEILDAMEQHPHTQYNFTTDKNIILVNPVTAVNSKVVERLSAADLSLLVKKSEMAENRDKLILVPMGQGSGGMFPHQVLIAIKNGKACIIDPNHYGCDDKGIPPEFTRVRFGVQGRTDGTHCVRYVALIAEDLAARHASQPDLSLDELVQRAKADRSQTGYSEADLVAVEARMRSSYTGHVVAETAVVSDYAFETGSRLATDDRLVEDDDAAAVVVGIREGATTAAKDATAVVAGVTTEVEDDDAAAVVVGLPKGATTTAASGKDPNSMSSFSSRRAAAGSPLGSSRRFTSPTSSVRGFRP
jgi:hypothetical protein